MGFSFAAVCAKHRLRCDGVVASRAASPDLTKMDARYDGAALALQHSNTADRIYCSIYNRSRPLGWNWRDSLVSQ